MKVTVKIPHTQTAVGHVNLVLTNKYNSTQVYDVIFEGRVIGEATRDSNYIERVPISKGSVIGKDLSAKTNWSFVDGFDDFSYDQSNYAYGSRNNGLYELMDSTGCL